MAGAPPTYAQPLQGGGLAVKGITDGVVWWSGGDDLFLVSSESLF